MQIKKQTILLLLILSFISNLYAAWGDGTKLSDGSCKFDLETGYQGLSVYTKDNEGFIIIDGGDSRYGTISTVYNGLNCKEITSGEKFKSNFSEIMERKGFKKINLKSKDVIDKSFQNKITFLKNSDELIVHIEPIPNSVTQELNTLLSSLSDKSASSQINISDAAKEFLSYDTFYTPLFNRLNTLSKTEINYNYALALIKELQKNSININSSKSILLAKQEELKKQIARIEKETNDKFFDLNVKSIKDVPQWIKEMKQLGKQELISDYIPKIINLSDFGKNLNFNNFLTSIEYKYILKNMQLKKVREIKDGNKRYGIALVYPNKTIKLTQKPTCKSTGRTSTSEFSCGFFLMNTCVGTYDEYNCKGNTSKIAQLEKTLLGTTKVANRLNKGWKYEPMISRYTKTNNHSNSNNDYVQIEAECINGFFPCIEKNLHVSGGPGRFEPSYNGASSGTIYKDYQGNTAGTYSFSVQFDDNICTGSFHISGTKSHYTIALGKDCHNNGSREW